MSGMATALETLSLWRIKNDLSYRELSALTGINDRTLFRLLTTPGARANVRTAFKIDKFLATVAKRTRR
jgi:hypothetical protein